MVVFRCAGVAALLAPGGPMCRGCQGPARAVWKHMERQRAALAVQALEQFLAARRTWVAERLAAAAAAPGASADDAARVLSEVAAQLQARPWV